MAANTFYETATRCYQKRKQQNIIEYCEKRLAEETKRNPLCTGLTYTNGKIEFRYAKESQKISQQHQALIKMKLWWARQGVYL